jgi:zinc/manganese transport system permease protein
VSGFGNALSLLLLPLAASVVFVLIHAYFGVHVLRRNVVFADLALAQLAALGATIAFAAGYAPTSAAGFGYAFLFTAIGAGLLTLARMLARTLSPEAFIGILYVGATAATILVVDRSPQGAEHVKKILVGSILSVGESELLHFAALYAAVGLVHWLARRPLLAASLSAAAAGRGRAVWFWDFVFFLSFGVVVTSSVATAGVLLVFSFLIVPAVIGSIFVPAAASRGIGAALLIAWAAGVLASALGLAGSYALDLPTGAAMVTAFMLVLVLAGAAKFLLFAGDARRRNRRVAARAGAAAACLVVLASSLWLIANPHADQPLLALFERASGVGPEEFLSPGQRQTYLDAIRDTARYQAEVERLNAKERAARSGTTPLPDEEIRRIASYQRSFNEMARGERFVQDVLRGKARDSQRWAVGVPAALVAGLGLAWLAWPQRRRIEAGPARPSV